MDNRERSDGSPYLQRRLRALWQACVTVFWGRQQPKPACADCPLRPTCNPPDFLESGSEDRRQFRRFAVNSPGECEFVGDRLPCRVIDISLGGAKVHFPDPAPAHVQTAHDQTAHVQTVALNLPGIGRVEGDVAWHMVRSVGIRFTDEPGSVAGVISALLPQDEPRAISA